MCIIFQIITYIPVHFHAISRKEERIIKPLLNLSVKTCFGSERTFTVYFGNILSLGKQSPRKKNSCKAMSEKKKIVHRLCPGKNIRTQKNYPTPPPQISNGPSLIGL